MADNLSGQTGLNRKRRVFFARETTFGTMVKPSASDAAKIRSGQISSHKPNRIDVEENRSSRSVENRYTGNTPPTPWEFEFDIRPSGTDGTPPDNHPLWKAAFGGYTNTPATSDAYALADVVAASPYQLDSVSIHDFIEGGASTDKHGFQLETLTGALVDECTISGSGTESPKVKFSGMGKRYTLTARTAIDDAAPDATIAAVDDLANLRVGSIVAIYETADGTTLVHDNAGVGLAVTDITGTVVTVDSDISVADGVTGLTAADNDIIAPWCPTETVAGSPISPTLGSLTIGGVTVVPIDFEISLKNNLKYHDNEAFSATMTGFHEGYRDVTARFTYRLQSSLYPVLTQRDDFGLITCVLTLGTAAGSICTITFKGEIDFENLDRTMDETVIAVLPMRGKASAANAADELAVVFT